MYFSFVFPLSSSLIGAHIYFGDERSCFLLSFFTSGWGHDYDRLSRSGAKDKVILYKNSYRRCFGSGGAAPWPFGPLVAG